jgi:hypothetical protein
MTYVGKKPADIIATAVDTTTGTFSGDLTVDTSTLYVDSANNRVGINETVPFAKLHISDTQTGRTSAGSTGDLLVLEDDNNGMSIISSNSGQGHILFGDVDDGAAGAIAYDHSSDKIRFRTNSTWDRMIIDSSGNVGIGTSSPAYDLHIHQNDSGNAVIHFTNTATGSTGTDGFTVGIDASEQGFIYMREANPILFATNNTERMRIDSSGNLLVGKTSYGSVSTDGTTISPTFFQTSATDDRPMLVNLNGDDGNLIEFLKAGAAVGSIGTFGSALYFASPDGTDAGLRVGNSTVVPVTTTGALRDNAIDLGSASARWKDLYLSGGVYLGGTGSANKLDDYEEGTHVTTVSADSGTPSIGGTEDRVSYTKIGNAVLISGQLGSANVSGCSGAFFVTMPFVTLTLADRSDFYFAHANTNTGNSISYFILSQTGGGSSTFQVNARMTDGTTNTQVATLLASAGSFDINIASMHYKTSA